MPTSWLLAIIGIFAAVAYGLLVWQRARILAANEFLAEVKAEIKRVTWPGKLEVRNTTWVVLVAVFFFGMYLYAVDLVVLWARQALYAVVGAGGGPSL